MASERPSPWTIETIAGRRVLRVTAPIAGTRHQFRLTPKGRLTTLVGRHYMTAHCWDAELCGTTLAAIRAALTGEG